MPLCILGGGKVVTLAVAGFSLAWTHTIERIPWEEDWRVEPGQLVLEESRIKGSGAGMEPAPDARLVDGWFVWQPNETRKNIVLRRAPEAGDWRICPRHESGEQGPCQPLGAIMDTDPVTLKPCDLPAPAE